MMIEAKELEFLPHCIGIVITIRSLPSYHAPKALTLKP